MRFGGARKSGALGEEGTVSDVRALGVPACIRERRELAKRALLHAGVETSRFSFLQNRQVLAGGDALRPALRDIGGRCRRRRADAAADRKRRAGLGRWNDRGRYIGGKRRAGRRPLW